VRPADFDRESVWRRFGAPSEQEGGVNEARTQRCNGFVWNEKWVYLDPAKGRVRRVVLWNRYDPVAILRVDEDGRCEPVSLDDA